MSIKTKVNIQALKGLMPKIRAEFLSSASGAFGAQVNQQIQSGISPVAGQGRFVGYSESYKEKMGSEEFDALGKKPRPVNLTLTGYMLSTQKVSVGSEGLKVSYSDPKAEYHNTSGAGRSRVLRRMLPTNEGEVFSRVLMKWLTDRAASAVKKFL